jgi:1,4-dihydroxy-2-naphthoate octaprenyltransferase
MVIALGTIVIGSGAIAGAFFIEFVSNFANDISDAPHGHDRHWYNPRPTSPLSDADVAADPLGRHWRSE